MKYLWITILFVMIQYISIDLIAEEDKRYKLTTKKDYLIVWLIGILFLLTSLFGTDYLPLQLVGGLSAGIFSCSLYTDARLKELPDFATLLLFVVSFMFLLIHPTNALWRILAAAIVAIAVGAMALTIGGIGFGDAKLLIPIVLYLDTLPKGIGYLTNVTLVAFVYALSLIIRGKSKNAKFAFGPFLIVGLYITMFILPESILAFL